MLGLSGTVFGGPDVARREDGGSDNTFSSDLFLIIVFKVTCSHDGC